VPDLRDMFSGKTVSIYDQQRLFDLSLEKRVVDGLHAVRLGGGMFDNIVTYDDINKAKGKYEKEYKRRDLTKYKNIQDYYKGEYGIDIDKMIVTAKKNAKILNSNEMEI